MAQHVPVLVTLGTLVDIEPFEGHEEVKDNVQCTTGTIDNMIRSRENDVTN